MRDDMSWRDNPEPNYGLIHKYRTNPLNKGFCHVCGARRGHDIHDGWQDFKGYKAVKLKDVIRRAGGKEVLQYLPNVRAVYLRLQRAHKLEVDALFAKGHDEVGNLDNTPIMDFADNIRLKRRPPGLVIPKDPTRHAKLDAYYRMEPEFRFRRSR